MHHPISASYSSHHAFFSGSNLPSTYPKPCGGGGTASWGRAQRVGKDDEPGGIVRREGELPGAGAER